jgi:3-hydroxymyristoyl/3-hydroxydecanoyl-(acyl carrier protein) dehydratase
VLPVDVLDNQLMFPGSDKLGCLHVHPELWHFENHFPQVSLSA